MIDLVAFDMAGTTIDDHGSVYRALAGAVEETGATVSDVDLQKWMGTDKVRAITALMELGGVQPAPGAVDVAFERFRAILADSYSSQPPVAIAGVEEALRTLRARGIKVSLTTGFSDDVAGPLLASLGWSVGTGDDDLLDAVVTTSDVPSGRPAPYLIHRAMERTGVVDTRAVLAAGDTVVDLQAARNAGVIAVGVLTGKLGRSVLESTPHDYILDSVVDVLDLSVATA
jgi:phosphoglycolate phosphatase